MKPTPGVRAASLATPLAIWGGAGAVIRIGLGGIPPFTGVALRFGIAGLVLWGAAFAIGLRGPRLRAPWWLWTAQGMLSFGVSYGLVYWGEQWGPSRGTPGDRPLPSPAGGAGGAAGGGGARVPRGPCCGGVRVWPGGDGRAVLSHPRGAGGGTIPAVGGLG